MAWISTLIPTFRRPEMLASAIRSVLSQRFDDLVVMVSDNASGDETEAVVSAIARVDPRVQYHKQPSNIGPLANMRSLLTKVRTPWFSFLSDDDLLLPDFYANAAERLAEFPQARSYFSTTIIHREPGGTQSVTPRTPWPEGLHAGADAAAMALSNPFTWTSCVLATPLLDRIGTLGDTLNCDQLFLGRAALAAPFVVDARPGAVYLMHGDNLSSRELLMGLDRSIEAALEQIEASFAAGTGAHATAMAAVRMYRSQARDALWDAVRRNQPERARAAMEVLGAHGWLRRRHALRARLAFALPPIGPVTRLGHRRCASRCSPAASIAGSIQSLHQALSHPLRQQGLLADIARGHQEARTT